jgi:DNA-binding response OmpR family regulator
MTSPHRPKILLLDDDESTAGLLALAFARMPYEARVVTSGLDALIAIFEAYRTGEPFNALVLDCALPHFDGFTIARIVRLAEKTDVSRRARIAFFTGYDKDVERTTLLEEVGAEAYWQKPNDVANLPELIRLWLEC